MRHTFFDLLILKDICLKYRATALKINQKYSGTCSQIPNKGEKSILSGSRLLRILFNFAHQFKL